MPFTDPLDQSTPPPTPAWRETGGLLLAAALLAVVYYHGEIHRLGPRWELFGWFGVNFVVLFGVPALVIRLIWRQPLSDYGLGRGKPEVWGKYLLAFGAVMVPVIVLASRVPSLHNYYPRYPFARESAWWFLAAAGGWLVYFFAWEFFFRGFLLNLLAPRYGGIAIAVQTVPFVLMHLPKPETEAFAAIIAGVALGIMAYRGKSMLGTWLLHWGVAVLMDVMVVVWR
jgi:membrane protease YdiL (CAAX protease family)